MNRHRPAATGSAAARHTPTTSITTTVTCTTSTKAMLHARTPSNVTAATPVGSTAPLRASLFITNLRLLDLDLLPEWPDITTATLTGPDVRLRIRAAEFALYHLFRLYNAAVAADKLQPFFPPLEPLQSVNLRAALYRCLLELKKSGILSRDIVLRKTMLDECHGEKFAELCLAFSAEVLRKTTRERKVKYIRPVAERMSIMPSPVKDSLLPLAIAHKASLAKVLERKQKQCETFAWLHEVLLQKEAELQDRRATTEHKKRKRTSSGQMEKIRALEKGLNMHWVGNDDFRSAVINGDEHQTGDGVLANSFEDFWQSNGELETPSKGADIGVLEDLERRVNQQSQRMRNWQASHDRIIKNRPSSALDGSPSKPAQESSLHLDQHRDLTLGGAPQDLPPPPSPGRTDKDVAALRYDEILTAMREDLRNGRIPSNFAPRRIQTTPAVSPRKVSDTRPGARNENPTSPPPTVVPIRPLMSRNSSISSVGGGANHARNPSRSRSYHAPKVVSQRQPIPLKTEAFSPRKGSQSSSTPPFSATSENMPLAESVTELADEQYSSHEERAESPHASSNARTRSVSWRASRFSQTSRASQCSEMDRTIDSGVGLGIDSDDKRSSVDASQLNSEDVETPMTTPLVHPNTTHIRHQSLAERTRMSMAWSRVSADTPLSPVVSESPSRASAPVSSNEPLPTERPSLAERTRQSISLAPAPVPAMKAMTPRHARTRSAYDVSCATPINTTALQRRDITPREDMFSPDAAYDSIFKSRPKIKLSPVISPRSDMDTSGLDGMIDSPTVTVGETF